MHSEKCHAPTHLVSAPQLLFEFHFFLLADSFHGVDTEAPSSLSPGAGRTLSSECCPTPSWAEQSSPAECAQYTYPTALLRVLHGCVWPAALLTHILTLSGVRLPGQLLTWSRELGKVVIVLVVTSDTFRLPSTLASLVLDLHLPTFWPVDRHVHMYNEWPVHVFLSTLRITYVLGNITYDILLQISSSSLLSFDLTLLMFCHANVFFQKLFLVKWVNLSLPLIFISQLKSLHLGPTRLNPLICSST